MPGSAGGSAVCLSQHGAILIVLSPWRRQIGLGAASRSSQDWLHQAWVAQYWCPLPLPRLEISALLQAMLTCLKALSFIQVFFLLYLYVCAKDQTWAGVQISSANRQLYLIPRNIHPLADVSSCHVCTAAAKIAYKADLHMGYVHIQTCWNSANIFFSVPNFKEFSVELLVVTHFCWNTHLRFKMTVFF